MPNRIFLQAEWPSCHLLVDSAKTLKEYVDSDSFLEIDQQLCELSCSLTDRQTGSVELPVVEGNERYVITVDPCLIYILFTTNGQNRPLTCQ